MNLWIRALSASCLLFAAAFLWLSASNLPPGWRQLSAEMLLGDASLAAVQSKASWQRIDQKMLAARREVYWLRFRLKPPEALRAEIQTGTTQIVSDQGLFLALRAASEVYLDGQLLGRNGLPGPDAKSEIPGQIDWLSPFPPQATGASAAQVEVLIRASSHRLPKLFSTADAYVYIGDMEALQAFRYLRWLVIALACGVILGASLYFLAIYRSQGTRQRSGTYLLLLGCLGLLLPWLEAWRFLWGYSYVWHGPRLIGLQVLHSAVALLLPIYLSARMQVHWARPWWALWLAVCALIWLLVAGADSRMWLMHMVSLLISLITIIRAPKDEDWATILLLILSSLALALLSGTNYLDGFCFIALAVLMLSLLLSHTRELLRTAARTAQIDTERARLRAELLGRGMQPHWLLNALTAMQELIEQDPTHASLMVQRLAEEFQSLRAVSERARIPLAEELALCSNHLQLRALVHGMQFSWQVQGEVQAITLPPGIVHALIENAFTHAGATACAVAGFEFSVHKRDARWLLRLSSALAVSRRRALESIAQSITESMSETEPGQTPGRGTGTAFIQASLEVAFPKQWRFTHCAQDQRWIAELSVPELSGPCAS